jgi:pimeloyl-ACP methyl ester carboxylesterase
MAAHGGSSTMGAVATTVDGVHVAFDVVGSGDPVVFVHGLGDERTTWAPIVARLENRFTCVSLDLRGHGETTGAVDFDPFGLHRDLRCVVETLRLSSPVVVGHSLGGFAVTAYAARHETRAVVNVDQPMDLRPLSGHLRELQTRLATEPLAPILLGILESIGLGALSQSAKERLRTSRAKLARETVLGIWRPLLERDGESLERATTAMLRAVAVPYLSLHGNEPAPGYAEWLRHRAVRARCEVWPGTGHFLHLVEPDRFVDRLTRFLSSPHGEEEPGAAERAR